LKWRGLALISSLKVNKALFVSQTLLRTFGLARSLHALPIDNHGGEVIYDHEYDGRVDRHADGFYQGQAQQKVGVGYVDHEKDQACDRCLLHGPKLPEAKEQIGITQSTKAHHGFFTSSTLSLPILLI
jgi:hypothetical protein